MRLIVHKGHRFQCPPNREKPEFYTHISIDAFAGRSLDAKRELYRLVVERLEPFEIPKDHIIVMIREITTENWGIQGGKAACDVYLGFKIDV